MRYLNIYAKSNTGDIYKYSFERFTRHKTQLYFEESKFEELFELADKAIYLSASMLEIDISEIDSMDNFKECFTFTVNMILFFSLVISFSKFPLNIY